MRLIRAFQFMVTCAFLTTPVLAFEDPDSPPQPVHPQRGAGITVGPDPVSCDYTSLQDAIFDVTGDATILLADGINHSGESYNIFPQGSSLTIRGGFDSCDAGSTPSGRTTIDTGGTGRPFTIVYTAEADDPTREVSLENLVLTGGVGDTGGGLRVIGRPGRLRVELRNVEITGNSHTGANGHGGGLQIRVTGKDVGVTAAMVDVDGDSRITSNTAAGKGGGVYCENFEPLSNVGSSLSMDSTLVAFNSAANGGGIAIDACYGVRLKTGGPIELVNGSFFRTGGIIGNEADTRGGGILVENGALVFVSGGASDHPDHAAMILANSAEVGGGVAVRSGANIQLENVFVENNSAAVAGGGIRIEDAFLYMSRDQAPGACEPTIGNGTSVLVRPLCSRLLNNESGGRGGAISAKGATQADFARTRIQGNSAGDEGSAVAAGNSSLDSGAGPDVYLENVLLTGNSGIGVIRVGNNATVSALHTTFADNGPTPVARLSAVTDRTAQFSVFSSILGHPSPLVQSFGDGTTSAQARCVISQVSIGQSGFDTAEYYSEIDPGFRNAGNQDFHLSLDSPAIDYCDGQNAPNTDGLDGNARGQLWTGPAPIAPPDSPGGFYDLGAYEAIFNDLLFEDRFEF